MPRVVLGIAATSALVALGSCGGNEPVDPGGLPGLQPRPEWNAENCPDGLAGQHLRVQFAPTFGRIEIGDSVPLTVFAENSSLEHARCRVFLRLDRNLRLTDSTTVVAGALGTVRMTALLPEDSVTATLNVVPASPIMPRRYRVIDLTAAVGDDAVVFTRMNSRRETVGNVKGRGVLWRPEGLQYLDGCAWAFDVNVRDEVPCFLNPGVGVWRGDSMTKISELRGADRLSAVSLSINDSGVVAGSVWTLCPGCNLFEWRDGSYASIASAVPPSLFQFEVRRINNVGQIFVSNRVDEYIRVVYIVKDAQLVDRSFIGIGQLSDANDRGVIVGSVQSRPGSAYALLGLVDHGSQERLGLGIATSVNSATQVVGTLRPQWTYGEDSAQFNSSLRGAFYWDRAAGVTRLRWSAIDPSWIVTEALQIIDDGTVLAKADNTALGRIGHTVILVPDP